jgi:MoxR-like ATPase
VRHYVRYGSSPRGGQAMVLGAKVHALLQGRYNVSFDDVHAVAHAALRHRILLNFEGQAEGIVPDEVIRSLLTGVPLPTGGR